MKPKALYNPPCLPIQPTAHFTGILALRLWFSPGCPKDHLGEHFKYPDVQAPVPEILMQSDAISLGQALEFFLITQVILMCSQVENHWLGKS